MNNRSTTIVSDNAERLVREGGVHNDWYGIPEPGIPHDEPFDAMVVESQGGSWNQGARAFPVRVVDVHHAGHCYNHDAATIRALAEVEEGRAGRIGFGDFCHPDAQPGMWHWTVEPIGGDA